MVDFASVPAGTLPTGFTSALTGGGVTPRWAVVEDASAPGGRALAETSRDKTNYRFPLAIWGGVTATDVEATIRFRPVGGAVDQAAGIAVRLADPQNYYVVRANALEDNVNLYRVVDGKRSEIVGHSTKVTGGEWHELGIRIEGERIQVSFDGRPLFSQSDKTFNAAGRVALWTKADSVTEFAELNVRELP